MATTLISSLVDDGMVSDASGVPYPLAIREIRNAAIELCNRSKVWIIDHDPLSTVVAQAAYQFEPPSGAVVSEIQTAWHDGLEIQPTTSSDLYREYANWPTLTGTPYRYLQENSEEVILFPIPTAALANALTMKVALKPKRTATFLEGWLVEKYYEAIQHGALARLFALPTAAWSNGPLAAYHGVKFEDAISKVQRDAARAHTKARLRTVPQFF